MDSTRTNVGAHRSTGIDSDEDTFFENEPKSGGTMVKFDMWVDLGLIFCNRVSSWVCSLFWGVVWKVLMWIWFVDLSCDNGFVAKISKYRDVKLKNGEVAERNEREEMRKQRMEQNCRICIVNA